MQITLLRHGTRNFGIGDAPLNAIGLKEADALGEQECFAKITQILSSPKKRAQMTIAPLSLRLKVPVQIWPEFDQQANGEDQELFARRVQKSLAQLEESFDTQDSILICSHSDWLNLAIQSMPSESLDNDGFFFGCAEYRNFTLRDGLWKLI